MASKLKMQMIIICCCLAFVFSARAFQESVGQTIVGTVSECTETYTYNGQQVLQANYRIFESANRQIRDAHLVDYLPDATHSLGSVCTHLYENETLNFTKVQRGNSLELYNIDDSANMLITQRPCLANNNEAGSTTTRLIARSDTNGGMLTVNYRREVVQPSIEKFFDVLEYQPFYPVLSQNLPLLAANASRIVNVGTRQDYFYYDVQRLDLDEMILRHPNIHVLGSDIIEPIGDAIRAYYETRIIAWDIEVRYPRSDQMLLVFNNGDGDRLSLQLTVNGNTQVISVDASVSRNVNRTYTEPDTAVGSGAGRRDYLEQLRAWGSGTDFGSSPLFSYIYTRRDQYNAQWEWLRVVLDNDNDTTTFNDLYSESFISATCQPSEWLQQTP